MSAAARSAAGALLHRIFLGDERVDDKIARALWLAQAEQDYIARSVPPPAAEQLAAADLERELAAA